MGFLNLGACALLSPSAPDDLKFETISAIDTKTLHAPEQGEVARKTFNPSLGKVLEVKFSSRGNILKYKQNWGDTYIWAVACRDWKDLGKMEQDSSGGYHPVGPLGMQASSVYWNDINVFNKFAENGPQGTEPFIYHFYIDVRRKSKYQPHASYDLNTNADDVCFQITSAEMFRQGAKTNVVTIPKEAIVTALTSQ